MDTVTTEQRTVAAPYSLATGPGSARVDGVFLERLAAQAAVASGRRPLEVEAPFTGETLGAVPRGTPDDMVAACHAARAAQPAWAAAPFSERAAVMLRFHDLVIANADEVLDLIQLEIGKARGHAFDEVLDAAITARYYAHTAEEFLQPRRRQGALPVLTTAREYHRPRGVIGFITPWNFPLILSITDAIAALMAGNAAVIKPDSQTPFTCLWAASLLREAGLPNGLLQIVTGSGAELGPALIDGVDYLMFTGSTATGTMLAQEAAARLMDYGMELGGKNAALVLNDAPHGVRVRGHRLGISTCDGLAVGIAAHAGQVCVSLERVYVQSGIYDRLVPKLAQALAGLRLGSGLTWDYDVGTLASADQLEKVAAHVDDAVGKGAQVLAGGRRRPDLGPYFFEPTLLAEVREDMAACRTETFGPVCAVYRFDDIDDAVAQINDCAYGLNASIWTRNGKLALELAGRMEAGTVGVNDAYQASWASASPMGGFKTSGVGRRHGRQGIVKYCEAQTVAAQRLVPVYGLPFLDHRRHAQVMGAAVKALKHVPGIK
jgi:succinate-semialdehyde dehydrogenase/glutarate-semialdehyde dehydrogenase